MARSRKAKSTKRSVDFSSAGKPFEKETAYHLVVKEAEWKEGQAGDYIAIEFRGVDEYENSSIYHNASFAPKALGRSRIMLEALGYEINDDGDTDIDTADLIGLEVMGETYEDRYDGGKSIKVDEFYPVEDSGKSSKKSTGKDSGKSSKKDEPEIDLEDLDEDDLKKLAKKLKVKGATKMDEDELREALGELDEGDVSEAAEELGLIEELANKSSGKDKSGSSKGRSEKKYSEDDVQEMSEEELEKLVKKHKLDVELDDLKTLRKKQNAVIDALESEDLIEG